MTTKTVVVDVRNVCHECLIVLANDDWSGIEESRRAEILAGFGSIQREFSGAHCVPGEEINDFSRVPCGCCSTPLAGSRHEMTIMQVERNG